jgi:thiol:disulfide interchange protein DsbD
MELLQYIGFGLVGGLILNVMPCVLPVLTMKVFHLLEHSAITRREQRLHGLAYTGGVIFSFLVLAAAVIALRASGERVGWGMQFQHAPFVATMVAVVFAFGLNALGVFEFSVSISGRPGGQGYGNSFANGILASVMSTPCSAPFLGSAAAFALGAGVPWWQTLALFLAIGVGLAAPFLAVSFVPGAGRMLPKPGPWMETFKALMGFTLLAAAVWLFGTLQAQISRDAATWFLAFLLVLAVALWGIHRFGGVIHATPRRIAVRVAAIAVVALAGVAMLRFDKPAAEAAPAAAGDDHIAWTGFDAGVVKRELAKKRPVFMDYTADWCANCKTNEKLFLETDAVRAALKRSGILPMKADMTNENEEIDKWLEELGRSGIPAYVIYLPDGTRDLLPEAITTEMVVAALDKAGHAFPPLQQANASAVQP